MDFFDIDVDVVAYLFHDISLHKNGMMDPYQQHHTSHVYQNTLLYQLQKHRIWTNYLFKAVPTIIQDFSVWIIVGYSVKYSVQRSI